MKFALTLAFLLLIFALPLYAWQESDDYSLRIKRTDQPIKLDGALDEACWNTEETAEKFKLIFPNDTAFSTHTTVARLAFDDKFLYIGAICRQRRADYTVQSYRRDFGPGTTDVLNVMFDPTRDGLNGFIFSVSPYNVQREGLISNGDQLALEWDNKWYSAVQNFDDYWTVEFAIPFKTLRYTVSETHNEWGLQFIRTKVKDFETSVWRPVPFQYRPTNVAFCGRLIWDTPPPKPGRNVSIIPYVIGSYGKEFVRDADYKIIEKPETGKLNFGGDAKIALTPGLNLDLTVNPDFSQVEVDRQVANLSRFELFFPETRQFFLENRDLFALFGFPNSRAFFSRRIGLAFNPTKGINEKVPIWAGARLSGKVNDGLRIGLLNMQTAERMWSTTQGLPQANFTVATAQQKVFERSTISAIFVNKHQFLNSVPEIMRTGYQPWNRVAGLEYNLYSKDNRWEGEWFYHRSMSPDAAGRGGALASFLGYRDRYFNARLGYQHIDSTYRAEAGFVPRPGVQGLFPGIGIQYYPKKGWGAKYVANYSSGIDADLTLGLGWNGQLTDADLALYSGILFKDQANLNLALYYNYTYLFEPFDPTNLYEPGTQPLPVGEYPVFGIRTEYFTGTSYNWQGELEINAGGFFKGNILSIEGRLAYRLQPVGLFSVLYSFNRIRQPEPYASADFWLLGPRIELAFNRNLFLSSFFQYNTQYNNFNINARLQWRYAPVSDLFLVYTDNSFAEEIKNTSVRFFSPKNKALVLKVVYWLNV